MMTDTADEPHHAARHSPWWNPLVLAFVAAFVDAVSFFGINGTFVAFVTGTIIILGVELATPEAQSTLKMATIGAFCFGVLLWVSAIKTMYHFKSVVGYLLGVQAALLALMAVTGVRIEHLTEADGRDSQHLRVVGANAKALQKAVFVEGLRLHPLTTVMTGNLTRLMLRLIEPSTATDTHPERKKSPRAWRRGVWTNAAILLVFATGALAGAYGSAAWGFRILAVPAALVAVASVNAFFEARLPR